MSIKNRKEFSKEKLEEAIANTPTMGAAAKYLKVDWRTFRYNAELHNLYVPTPPGDNKKFELEDILNGKHPQYSTNKLRIRLILDGLKEAKCECCGILNWKEKPINFELDHIDGDNSNHSLDNLRVLCPNCHSQTDSFRNKKRKIK